jgi:hypothetical protein
MRRPAVLFGLSGLLFIAYETARMANLANHTSAVAGMPLTESSWLLGPLHIALYLLVVIVAPILAIAGTLDTLLRLRRPRARMPSPSEGVSPLG